MATDIEEMVKAVAERLRAAQIPLRGGEQADWQREARLLISSASTDDPTRSLEQLIGYRLQGIPLGYLVGTEFFLGDEFVVETGVVIPHPATELLALLALQAINVHGRHTDRPRLLEVGVGVGVIALSVLKRRPHMEAHCSELSGAALRLTRENSMRVRGGTENLYLYQAYVTDDIFSAFQPRPVTEANVLVSNPPYLVEGDEVSEATKKSGIAHFSYAPENDPSWFLRRIAAAPEGVLSKNCSVLMECAEWYASEHEEVMRDAGWRTEVFDRETYIADFGALPEMRPMAPTAHRVLHAWRGISGGLRN